MIKSLLAKKEKGQALVIVAVAFMTLLFFVGLAIDGTELFLSYTRLKRAVDAAAVAAANDFKQDSNLEQMKQAAIEVLGLQQVRDAVNVAVYKCYNPDDAAEAAALQAAVPNFYAKCPTRAQVDAGTPQRKLVYVRADENSPTFFLGLLGLYSVPITTNSVSEAASVDLVIVIDTSMSMGFDTNKPAAITADFNPNLAAPNGCNNTDSTHPCQPLKQARDAAIDLVNKLFFPYDRVAIVTFDTVAQSYTLGGKSAALDVLNNSVRLHYDPPATKLFPYWFGSGKALNLINPEDRDGLGTDPDAPTCIPDETRWDNTLNVPCDDNNMLDAFDWNSDGTFFTAHPDGNCPPGAFDPSNTDDLCNSKYYIAQNNPLGLNPAPPISFVSTCTGCGIRVATNILVQSGRSNSVWVMVFLTDGATNMSDTPATSPYDAATNPRGVTSSYPNGYCNGQVVVDGVPGPKYPGYRNDWLYPANCQELVPAGTRYCINALDSNGHNTCPLYATQLTGPGSHSPPYGVQDYAMDMTDAAALRTSDNPYEKLGNTIAIYTIGLGDDVVAGAPLLRYMAKVGADGSRLNDPCSTHPNPKESCGQYYFAQTGNSLAPIFRDIASRIYTKITE